MNVTQHWTAGVVPESLLREYIDDDLIDVDEMLWSAKPNTSVRATKDIVTCCKLRPRRTGRSSSPAVSPG